MNSSLAKKHEKQWQKGQKGQNDDVIIWFSLFFSNILNLLWKWELISYGSLSVCLKNIKDILILAKDLIPIMKNILILRDFAVKIQKQIGNFFLTRIIYF